MTLILKYEERERGRQGEIGKDIHIYRDKERETGGQDSDRDRNGNSEEEGEKDRQRAGGAVNFDLMFRS